jgi:hypothetical protein
VGINLHNLAVEFGDILSKRQSFLFHSVKHLMVDLELVERYVTGLLDKNIWPVPFFAIDLQWINA